MLITRSWNKKATLIALRLCVAAATGVMLILYPPAAGLSVWLIAPWTAYFASTFVYLVIPAHWFRRRRFDITFVTVEVTLLGTMFAVYGGSESWFFYPLFLLVVLLAALARRLAWALALGFAVSVAMAVILVDIGTIEIGAIILQVGTLLTTAGIVGYLTEELGHEEVLSNQFESALEVSTLLAEAIEVESVYERLTEVLERLFHASRVAVILAKPGQTTGRIVSAIDASEVIEDLEIELERYPEIQMAIDEQRTVIIERPEKDPNLERVRRYLPPRAAGATILVTPIRQGNDVHGVVFVRLEQSYRAFSDQEIRFCRLMADIAGKAVQRADHFAEVSEAARRDPLTGLYNVRAFRQALTDEIVRSQRTGVAFSLVMIDIDFMKHINDTYGHPAGDHARWIGWRVPAARSSPFCGPRPAVREPWSWPSGSDNESRRGTTTGCVRRSPSRSVSQRIQTTRHPAPTSFASPTRRCMHPNTRVATGSCSTTRPIRLTRTRTPRRSIARASQDRTIRP